MPTTDTFIIPPMQPPEPAKDKPAGKKTGGGKTPLLIGIILLIVTLPVAVYYIAKQQQLADTRSRAASESCTKGTQACQISKTTGKNTGYMCKCVDTESGYVWSCGTSAPAQCPVEVATKDIVTGELPNVRVKEDGVAGGCKYIQKPPLSGLKPCNAETCGGSCGVYTGDCGNLCFDQSCAKAGCASGEGVGAKAETTDANPTDTPEPTEAPTPAPTNEPNSAACDASCANDNDCTSGLTCSSVNGINRCRNASCPAESTCSCPETTSETATQETVEDTAGQAMPVSGIGPGLLGSVTALGSVLLLLIGLTL